MPSVHINDHDMYYEIHGDGEPAALARLHVADDVVEPDPVAHARFFYPALDVIEQHGAGWIGGDWLAEMFFKRVIGEFQTFFGAI